MVEPLTIGTVFLLGYLLSGEKEPETEKKRMAVAANDIPSTNDRTLEVDKYIRKRMERNFQDSLNPYDTNVIPNDFNTLGPSNRTKRIPIVPTSLASSEGIPFVHTNMTPYFGGKITQNVSDDGGQRRLDSAHGGNQSAFFKKKKEIKQIFNPIVDRDPRFVEHRDLSYYENSMTAIQTGIKPFQEIHVGPGLGRNTDGVSGRDGFHYGNVRTFEPNVDELRVKGDQQKEEYKEPAARGNKFYVSKRTHQWKDIPKNAPETHFEALRHIANPVSQVSKRPRVREEEQNVKCTQREVADELPVGPPGAKEHYMGIKDDYSYDEYNLRNVKSSGVEGRPLGPQGRLSGRSAPMSRDNRDGSSVNVRNNLTGDIMVYNRPPGIVGNTKAPNKIGNLGEVRVKSDSSRLNRMRRKPIPDGTKYRDTTNKNADFNREHDTINSIRNPRIPTNEAWETEQHRKNPFTQSLMST